MRTKSPIQRTIQPSQQGGIQKWEFEDNSSEDYSSDKEILSDLNAINLEENPSQPLDTINTIYDSIEDYLEDPTNRKLTEIAGK